MSTFSNALIHDPSSSIVLKMFMTDYDRFLINGLYNAVFHLALTYSFLH